MHPSVFLSTLLLSLPLHTFAIPTPQDTSVDNSNNAGNAGTSDNAGTSQGTSLDAATGFDDNTFIDSMGTSDSTGTSTSTSDSTDSSDPDLYDRPVSEEEAAAALKDRYEDFQEDIEVFHEAVQAAATYVPTPQESAEAREFDEAYRQYSATASFEPWPTATGDYADSFYGDYVPTGTDAYELPKPTDPCGPDVQDGTEYSTCLRDPDGSINSEGSAFVTQSLENEPGYYSVACLPFPGSDASANGAGGGDFANAPTRQITPMNTTACHYKEFCASIQPDPTKMSVKPPTDQWIWNDWSPGCALGMWLPSDPAAADWPDATRCEYGILRMMGTICYNEAYGTVSGVDDGTTGAGASTNGSVVATVNLQRLQGGGTTGEQVNAGYPSYIVASETLTVLGGS
ncbi:MAG: hypothetical protein Q9221_001072 [Calogaya cf. arnoldii]